MLNARWKVEDAARAVYRFVKFSRVNWAIRTILRIGEYRSFWSANPYQFAAIIQKVGFVNIYKVNTLLDATHDDSIRYVVTYFDPWPNDDDYFDIVG